MQRRAVAVFVAFFLVVGSLSLGLVVTAESPTFDAEGRELQAGDSFTVGEQEYIVASVDVSESEDSTSYEAVFEWTIENDEYTESWGNDSTVEYDNRTWRVLTGEGDDPSTFTLEEEIDREAILEDDPNASNETVEHDGEEHVVVEEDGEERLVPADEYFPEPETREYSEGDTFDYNGNQTTVDAVSSSAVDLSWTADRSESTSAGQFGNVTLSEQTFYLQFQGEDTVVLSSDFDALAQYNEATSNHETQKNGLWGVTLLSGITAILLAGMAYMPSRY